MEKRMQYLLFAGFLAVLAVTAYSSRNMSFADGEMGAGGRFITDVIADGSNNNRPCLFVLDTVNRRLLLYDVVGSKLRFCAARVIHNDTLVDEFELVDKPGGSVKEIKAQIKNQLDKEKQANGKGK
jgi:hypothetical protein